jgi:hypothetical protein
MRQAINHPVAGAPILAKTVWLKKKASIGHYYGGSCIPALRRLPSFPMDHAPITGQQVIPSKNEKTSHWIRREPLGRHLPMPSAKKKWHTKWYISGINLPKAVTERMRSGLGQGGARNYNRRDVPRVYAFRIAWHRLRNRIDGPPEAHPFVLRPSLLDRRLLVSTNTGGFRASQAQKPCPTPTARIVRFCKGLSPMRFPAAGLVWEGMSQACHGAPARVCADPPPWRTDHTRIALRIPHGLAGPLQQSDHRAWVNPP